MYYFDKPSESFPAAESQTSYLASYLGLMNSTNITIHRFSEIYDTRDLRLLLNPREGQCSL